MQPLGFWGAWGSGRVEAKQIQGIVPSQDHNLAPRSLNSPARGPSDLLAGAPGRAHNHDPVVLDIIPVPLSQLTAPFLLDFE